MVVKYIQINFPQLYFLGFSSQLVHKRVTAHFWTMIETYSEVMCSTFNDFIKYIDVCIIYIHIYDTVDASVGFINGSGFEKGLDTAGFSSQGKF